MSYEIEDRIGGYFDELLSGEELAELEAWIRADPANAQQFARAAKYMGVVPVVLFTVSTSPAGTSILCHTSGPLVPGQIPDGHAWANSGLVSAHE